MPLEWQALLAIRLVGGGYGTDQEHMDWIKRSTQQLNQQSSTALTWRSSLDERQ